MFLCKNKRFFLPQSVANMITSTVFMRFRSIRFALSLLLFWGFFFSSFVRGNPVSYLGWIPVQTLSGDKEAEFDLTRFLSLAPGDQLSLERPAPLEKTKVELDAAKMILRLHPAAGAQGMEDLRLKIAPKKGNPMEGIFTYAVQSIAETQFQFFGTGSEKAVSVAGSFNGWNTGANPMKKTGENTWALSLALPPGSHTYVS